MGNVKKTLLIAGIICLAVGLFSVGTLCLDLFVYEYNVYAIVVDSIEIALSLGTGIFYLVVRTKPVKEICKHNMLFFWIAIVNILNNLVAWVMSFWVEIVVSNNARFARINKVKEEKPKENGDIDVVDYEIERIKENLTTRLEELEDLKQRGMITEEEYQKLREEAINSYIK